MTKKAFDPVLAHSKDECSMQLRGLEKAYEEPVVLYAWMKCWGIEARLRQKVKVHASALLHKLTKHRAAFLTLTK